MKNAQRPADVPIIGVLTPLAGGFYYGGILNGISRTLAKTGGRMIAIQTLDAGYLNADFVESPPFNSRLAWDRVSGFVAIVKAARPEHLAAIKQTGKPLVMVSNEIPELRCPAVVPDNRGGIRDAVRHLVAHGHTRIGFAGFLVQSDIKERYEAYCETLIECGFEPDPALFYAASDNDEIGGRFAGEAMLAAGVPSTAVVAATDLNAIGILKTLRAAGRLLPRDQAVIGFDDTEAAAHVTPILSSIKQDFEQVGSLAAELVLAGVRGEAVPPGRRSVATTFVARESCGCTAWRTTSDDDAVCARVDPKQELLSTLQTSVQREARSGLDPEMLQLASERIACFVDAAGAGDDAATTGELRDAMTALHRSAPSPEAAAAIVGAIRRYARRAADQVPPRLRTAATLARIDDAAIASAWTLSQAQMREAYERDCLVQKLLTAQYDVSMELLQSDDNDPRELRWLARTQARAGVLGLWTGDAQDMLEVVGVFDRSNPNCAGVGKRIPTASFPPADLFTQDLSSGHLLFAVPVKAGTGDWGWLVTLGPIESTSLTGRETANQWGALLTVALDKAADAQELQTLERELRAILENSPDAIARYDAQLRYQYLNAAATNALHMSTQDIVGRTDRELGRHPAVAAVWEAGLRQVLASSTSTEIEFSESDETDTHWYQTKMVPQFDASGMIAGVLTSTRDLTVVKRAELALAHQAVHDSLTGLANRVLFVDRLSQALTRLEREQGRLAVLFIDLDRFKPINDTLGHDVGDRLLVEVARRLRSVSRRVDTVGRFGGDEFVLLCDKLSEDEDVRIIAERVVRALGQPFSDGDTVLDVSASIGIVVASDPYADVASILRDADAAMYQAKGRGGNRFHVSDPVAHG